MSPRADTIELSQTERRAITSFAAACARTALATFNNEHPEDLRPQEAIETAEAFAAGGNRGAALRTTAWAAHQAARQVASPPA